MKNDDTAISNILEIKTIGPLFSSKGIKIIFIDQKIKCRTIFAFFILAFLLSFFTNSVIFNIKYLVLFKIIKFNIKYITFIDSSNSSMTFVSSAIMHH